MDKTVKHGYHPLLFQYQINPSEETFTLDGQLYIPKIR